MAAEALKLKSILDVIDARLIPDAEAKKARGEVFTPLELVREMLFGLRKSDLERGVNTIWGVNEKGEFFDDDENNRVGGIPLEIWRDPDTKWLDPANGIGNFPFIAYYMLDYQLDKHGKDASLKGSENKLKRRKHIVKNMLYMIEINKGNVNTSRKIFKQLVPSVDANIICANSLLYADKLNKIFGITIFNVIMGNPPFNPPTGLWIQFINKYIDKTRCLTFVVPSTFTSNQTGKPVIENLKKNNLTLLRYLNESDFGGIALGMLYFQTDKKNIDNEILINNITKIKYTEPIINYEDIKEVNIFKKLKSLQHLKLYRGKNETLTHQNPRETSNIKFSKNLEHPFKMLSRLGGGELEIYWLSKIKKEEVKQPKIVFPRGTGSWVSFNNLIKLGKDIVFTTSVDEETVLSNGIMYTPMKNIEEFENYRFYLMRSKIVRLIFLRVNHLAELTPFIFEYIPDIPVSEMTTDEKINKAIGLSEQEQKYLNSYFEKQKPTSQKTRGAKSEARRRTRKLRRFF